MQFLEQDLTTPWPHLRVNPSCGDESQLAVTPRAQLLAVDPNLPTASTDPSLPPAADYIAGRTLTWFDICSLRGSGNRGDGVQALRAGSSGGSRLPTHIAWAMPGRSPSYLPLWTMSWGFASQITVGGTDSRGPSSPRTPAGGASLTHLTQHAVLVGLTDSTWGTDLPPRTAHVYARASIAAAAAANPVYEPPEPDYVSAEPVRRRRWLGRGQITLEEQAYRRRLDEVHTPTSSDYGGDPLDNTVGAPSLEPPFKPDAVPALVMILPADSGDALRLMAKSAALAMYMSELPCFALSLPLKVLRDPLARRVAATCLSHELERKILNQCIRGV